MHHIIIIVLLSFYSLIGAVTGIKLNEYVWTALVVLGLISFIVGLVLHKREKYKLAKEASFVNVCIALILFYNHFLWK